MRGAGRAREIVAPGLDLQSARAGGGRLGRKHQDEPEFDGATSCDRAKVALAGIVGGGDCRRGDLSYLFKRRRIHTLKSPCLWNAPLGDSLAAQRFVTRSV